MDRFIHRLALTLACLGVVSAARSTTAQSEDLEIEHSPNARHVLRKHAEKRADLEADFLASLAEPAKRFQHTCDRQVKRYTAMLEREVRSLTRAGSIEEAKAVQAAMQRAGSWQVTAPDSKGLHFLSKVNLEVPGSENATKLGVDLLVGIETAGEAYAKQVDRSFEQYKTKVAATRQTLQGELVRINEQEQRAGRLEAVDELNKAITALKQLPEAERPVPETEQAEEPVEVETNERPSYAGFYLIEYETGFLDNAKLMIQLDEEGGTVHRAYLDTGRWSWKDYKDPIRVEVKDKRSLVLTHQDHMRKRDMVHELKLSDGVPLSAAAWPDKEAHRIGQARCDGSIRVLGSPNADLLGLQDGTYVMAMDMHVNSRRQEERKTYSMKIKVSDGVIYRTHRNWTLKASAWHHLGMEFFTVTTGEDVLTLRFDQGMHNWNDHIEIHLSGEGDPKVRYWWNHAWKADGDRPSLVGKLIRVKE
ncbi:MAG: hypothetical protein AAGB26_15635 [Planctomycetota bacterium]